MKDSIAFISLAPTGVRIGAICLFLPIMGIATIVLLGSPPSLGLVVPFVAGWVISGILLVSIVWNSSAYLKIGEENITVGLFPLWRTRIPLPEIAKVSVMKIDPYVQYRGWGIKGSSKARAGRLYSVGGEYSTLIRTTSNRTFLIGFRSFETAKSAEAMLAQTKGDILFNGD